MCAARASCLCLDCCKSLRLEDFFESSVELEFSVGVLVELSVEFSVGVLVELSVEFSVGVLVELSVEFSVGVLVELSIGVLAEFSVEPELSIGTVVSELVTLLSVFTLCVEPSSTLLLRYADTGSDGFSSVLSMVNRLEKTCL